MTDVRRVKEYFSTRMFGYTVAEIAEDIGRPPHLVRHALTILLRAEYLTMVDGYFSRAEKRAELVAQQDSEVDPTHLIAGTAATATPNKGFGTGKGTSARILAAMSSGAAFTVAEVAFNIGLPSRQLHKRFAELVKAGKIVSNGTFFGVKDYRKAA